MAAFVFNSEYDPTPYIAKLNDCCYEVSLDGNSEGAIEFSREEVEEKLNSGEWIYWLPVTYKEGEEHEG